MPSAKPIQNLSQSSSMTRTAPVPDFNSSTTLIFTPLEDPESIRILQLWPGTPSHHLKCSLQQIKLPAGHHPYRALSYAWGDWENVESRRSVECDEAKAVISANLHSALSRIRETEESVLLWVDALCINQSTEPDALKERALQVAMMSRIFSQAESVYVDLGDAGEEDLELVSFLSPCLGKAHLISGLGRHCPLSELHQVAILPGLEHRCWVTLSEVWQRVYWQRLWVLQEFAMAKKICVLLGTCRLDESFVASLVFSLHYFFRLITDVISEFGIRKESNVELGANKSVQTGLLILDSMSFTPDMQGVASNIDQFVVNRQNAGRSTNYAHVLGRCLDEGIGFDVTDPRDRVYAILSLTREPMQAHNASFEIDYAESVDTLSLRLATHLIKHGGGCHVLARCVNITAEGPSWRYDLRGNPIDRLPFLVGPAGTAKQYQGNGDSIMAIDVIEDGQVLQIDAVMLDTIIDTTAQCEVQEKTRLRSNPAAVVVGVARWVITLSVWFDSISERTSHQLFSPVEFWRAAVMDYEGRNSASSTRTVENPEFDNVLEELHSEVLRLRGFVKQWPSLEDVPIHELLSQFSVLMMIEEGFDCTTAQRMALTRHNFLCVVPEATQPGDHIAFICGMPLPFVLRPKGEDMFAIVGLCYVHNMMDGQAFQPPSPPVESILLC